MASRFWGRGSDSEDESDADATSSAEESEFSDSDSDSSGKGGAERFLAGSDSDESEDDKRVVRSAKDKRFEELAKSCDEIRNKMKVNDWTSIQTIFDKAQKQLEKAQKAVAGSTGSAPPRAAVPRAYIATLCELEDFLNETLANREVKKKMSSTNAKALNIMKQRLRKYVSEYEAAMAAWRENPVLTDDEASSEEDEEASSEAESGEGGGSGGESDGAGHRRDRKRDELLTMDPAKVTYEMVSAKQRELAQARGRRGTDRQEHIALLNHLTRLAKGPVQRLEVLMQLVSTLFDLSSNLNMSIPVPVWQRATAALFSVAALLDTHRQVVLDDTTEVPSEPRTAEPEPGEDGLVRVAGNVRAFFERLDDELFKILQMTDSHTTEYVARLREELPLLALGDQVAAYLERVGDHANRAHVALRQAEHFYYKSAPVYASLRALVEASKAAGAAAETAAAAAGADATAAAAAAAAAVAADGQAPAAPAAGGPPAPGAPAAGDKLEEPIALPIPASFSLPEDCHALMRTLVDTIYVHGDERSRARAVLCRIYHRCIHGDFHGARDALLMSHLQDQVHTMDISTQILHNRAMTQLGLAAFRGGLIPEAHACLAELYGSGKLRELLAQGTSLNRWTQEKTPEQEKLERRRQMPFHMHINLEMAEAAYLIAAMLLEVPHMAAAALGGGMQRRPISRPFVRLLETYRNQVFTGPPESVRDHVMASARAVGRGDWARAYGFIAALKMWPLVPEREAVQEMLMTRVKRESLRTFLFTYSAQYRALSREQLCRMFELDACEVTSIVSSMMSADELHGSWDQPTATIVMRGAEPSRLQAAAASLALRANLLVELNERAVSFRTGALRADDDHGDGDGFGGHKGGRGRRDWDDSGAFGRKGGGGRGGGRGDRRGGGGGGYGGRMGGGGGYQRDGGFGGAFGDRGGPRRREGGVGGSRRRDGAFVRRERFGGPSFTALGSVRRNDRGL